MADLPVLTNSALAAYRRCPREYQIAYVRGIRPRETEEALAFGTAWHLGLEALWRGHGLDVAIAAATESMADPYAAATLRVLLRGYEARWGAELHADALAVETEFRSPLINPETGAASRTFQLGGKIDVLLRDGILEHKTSSRDISFGSPYWHRLSMDGQVSTYFAGARALGVEPRRCVYDVVKKPTIRPYKATPPESRKYTKDGRLYANQREHDETPEEWELRLAEDVVAQPDAYYRRGEVVRLDAEETEHARDVWLLASSIRESARLEAFPRNPDACERYGRFCPYFAACSGEASLEDTTRYVRLEHVHPELQPAAPADAAE